MFFDVPAPLAKQHGLTDSVWAFVSALSRGADMSGAANKAGLSREYCYDLIRQPSVMAAVMAETRRNLAVAAPLALDVLINVAKNEKMAPGVRVDAAKALLDRAGFVAPRGAGKGEGPLKSLNEMNVTELRDLADKLEGELAGRAKPLNAPDVEATASQVYDVFD